MSLVKSLISIAGISTTTLFLAGCGIVSDVAFVGEWGDRVALPSKLICHDLSGKTRDSTTYFIVEQRSPEAPSQFKYLVTIDDKTTTIVFDEIGHRGGYLMQFEDPRDGKVLYSYYLYNEDAGVFFTFDNDSKVMAEVAVEAGISLESDDIFEEPKVEGELNFDFADSAVPQGSAANIRTFFDILYTKTPEYTRTCFDMS